MNPLEAPKIYKVSEITRIVKGLLEDSPVSNIWLEGEVSNFKQHTSGHLYFTLKDNNSQIKCVIFRQVANYLGFIPENGISIVIYGSLTVYERDGVYQIIGSRIMPLGLGALQLAFEQLKNRLASEGLFDIAHKKLMPLVPKRIGIITSPTGAAIRDMLSIISRRFYNISILIHPVNVQGDGAAEEIAAAIENMNKIGDLDVLIVGRGGGSLEDLWAFNEEIVARSIYASQIPVISAVGHEIDFTISDFVADYRAATPSAAAEMVIPNKEDLTEKLANLRSRLNIAVSNNMKSMKNQSMSIQRHLLSHGVEGKINTAQQIVDHLLSRIYDTIENSMHKQRRILESYKGKMLYTGIPAAIREMQFRNSNLEQRCINNMLYLIETLRNHFDVSIEKLDALSPLSILKRGYSLCYSSDGIIKDASEVSMGDVIKVRLDKGELVCSIKEVII